MTAPGQAPVQPVSRSPWYASRIILLVATVCFFFAALTFGGNKILSANGYEWLAAGFAAWTFAGVVA